MWRAETAKLNCGTQENMTGDPTGQENVRDGGTGHSTREVRPSDLALTLLDDQIDNAQHDIESIETHIDKQDNSALAIELVRLLRQLQDMYQRRITSLESRKRPFFSSTEDADPTQL
jgi:hypothetical protein